MLPLTLPNSQDGRFENVHMDLIGPMLNCDGYLYCLTLIDRFSRWTEAIPLKDITAQTVARAFYDGWIARFGAPRILTTDQGAQFESQLLDIVNISPSIYINIRVRHKQRATHVSSPSLVYPRL